MPEKQVREYQEKSRHWVNREINNNNNPLLVAPTGTGKTYIGTNIIKDRISLHEKNIVLVPQLEIFSEWIKEFSKANLNYGYIDDSGINGKNKDVYVAMFQSLSNMLVSLPEKFVKSFSNVFTDECHRSAAQSYIDIYDCFSHCNRSGWTATPYRLDNKPLNQFYDCMHESIKMSEAINRQYLCKPHVIIPDEYKNNVPDQSSIENIDFNEQRFLILDKKIIGDTLKTYSEVFNGLPVIVPCSGYEHAKIVTAMFESAGWKVGHLHSKLNKYERRRIVREVETGKINILITVGVGVEGMNIPGLYGIIWLRFTESLTIYMQFNGRPMRPIYNEYDEIIKDKFIMVDPVGNSVIHGRPDIDRKWSLDKDYMPGQDVEDEDRLHMKICPVCKNVNAKENNTCWICEYDFITGLLNGEKIEIKKRKLPQFVDGRLVWLDEVRDERLDIECNNLLSHNRMDNNSICSSCNVDNQGNSYKNELTKAQKLELLKSDLTGVKNKNMFRKGIGEWL